MIQDVSLVDPALADKVYRPGEDGEIPSFTWTRDKADRPRNIEVFGSGENADAEIDVEVE